MSQEEVSDDATEQSADGGTSESASRPASDATVDSDSDATVDVFPDTTFEVDDAVDLDDPSLYLNRELSELAFQRRVLYEAVDERNPLLERAKFLAIVTRNMDELFMKRVGGLKQQMDAGVTELTPDGRPVTTGSGPPSPTRASASSTGTTSLPRNGPTSATTSNRTSSPR
jgi:polyphosphate kinase